MINNNNLKGGNVLASGGFGCIFQPALKCNDSILEPEPGEVRKLMTEKHAITEYSQIQTFKKILEKIPNYEEYFLVKGFSLCKPTKLSKEDKNNFRKCKALTKKGFTKDNINQEEYKQTLQKRVEGMTNDIKLILAIFFFINKISIFNYQKLVLS